MPFTIPSVTPSLPLVAVSNFGLQVLFKLFEDCPVYPGLWPYLLEYERLVCQPEHLAFARHRLQLGLLAADARLPSILVVVELAETEKWGVAAQLAASLGWRI